MQITPTITFRGIDRTAAIESDILARLRKLETYYPRITGARVILELVQGHHEAGNRYHVRIDLTVPGEEIAVSHEASTHAAAQDREAERIPRVAEPDPERKHARVAIREAFDVARRRLQDYARRQSGAVKTPVRRTPGHVVRLSPVDEFGYIAADEDGHEVYFQKTSVLRDAFDQLTVGSPVSFVEETGDKGAQASTVVLRHPHRARRAPAAPTGPAAR